MNILAFGGGTNSSAILAGWVEKGLQAKEPIEAILFADTGGEKPHTYEHIEFLNEWLPKQGLPKIITVTKGGRQETLEENCLRQNMLPSIAYGFKGCSHKYKIEPQEKWCNNDPRCKAWWAEGDKVTKLIGYDFAEERRWARAKLEDEKYYYRFPLVEWEWSRLECIEAIKRVGIPQPGKSACFFCPSSKKEEIIDLRDNYPDLFARAVAMEDNAQGNLKTVKGLGRRFAWRELIHVQKKEQLNMFPDSDIHGCVYCKDE
jgi:hypothetical protein